MFDVLYPGRRLVIDSPLSVEEVTQRLGREVAPRAMELRFREPRQQRFEGTFADGQFSFVRLVRGRNSFRPWMKGRLTRGPAGTRVDVHLQLHPLVLVLGLFFAVVASTVAALAAPDLPVVTTSPLTARVLAMAAVVFVFAALGTVEARTSTRLLRTVVGATPDGSHRASQHPAAQPR